MAVPTLPPNMVMTDKNGRVTSDFARWWQLNAVETGKVATAASAAQNTANGAETTANGALISSIVSRQFSVAASMGASAATGQAQTAVATANSAASGLASGAAVGVPFSSSSGTFTVAAFVDVVNVLAGTLRFDTTSIYALQETEIAGDNTFDGEFEITEEPTGGGVKNTLVSGAWSALVNLDGFVEASTTNQAALDAARPTAGHVGSVTYRLEVRRASGVSSISNALCDLRVSQA